MPVSKIRNIRIHESLWVLAGVVAKRRYETTSGMVKRILAEYVDAQATDEDRRKAAELMGGEDD